MADHSDPQMALMFSFYQGVLRKGPGNEASTLRALSMLHGLPPPPRIVDFGCGAGVASLVKEASREIAYRTSSPISTRKPSEHLGHVILPVA